MFTIAHNLQCRTTNVRTYLAVVSQVCSVMLPATDEIHNKRVSITKVQQQARHTENLRSCHDGPRVHQQMVFLALWRLWRLSAARAWEAQAQGMIQWSTTTQFLSSWVKFVLHTESTGYDLSQAIAMSMASHTSSFFVRACNNCLPASGT